VEGSGRDLILGNIIIIIIIITGKTALFEP
jgi:hypothetical protein